MLPGFSVEMSVNETPHIPARATTSYSEAQKLKSSLFLRDNFAPLPSVFRSIPDALHHILPNNQNMEFSTPVITFTDDDFKWQDI